MDCAAFQLFWCCSDISEDFPQLGLDRVLGNYAFLGVQVFFVISGFLITLLLRTEQQSTHSVSLRRFYLRRALRILPAYILYLIVLFGFERAGCTMLKPTDWVAALTFTVNYFPGASWEVGHLWSLAVEEQFYLLWPFLFVVMGGVKNKLRNVLLCVILLAPLVRAAMRLVFDADSEFRNLEIFPAIADGLGFGCLLALMRDELVRIPAYRMLMRSSAAVMLVLLTFVINRFSGYGAVDLLLSSVKLAMIMILVDVAVTRESGWFHVLLNCPPLVALGRVSFSLYLFQQLFLNRVSTSWLAAFPLNLLLALAVAMVSYHAVERPFMRLRP
jgi:peptidoglycan/LPS O-acetylase OafA/YrhL